MPPLPRYIILALTLLSSLVPAARNADADHAIELYRSEQYDFFFFYDASIWEILDQSSEAGEEFVRLTDGDVFVDYRAFDAPGMTPRDCVQSVLDQLAADPAIVAVESLDSPPGVPKLQDEIEGVASPLWSIELILTLDKGDDRGKLVTGEVCRELVPGESLLYTSTNVTAASWNAGRSWRNGNDPSIRPGIYPSLEPWVAMYEPSDEKYEFSRPAALVNSVGNVVGTLFAQPNCVNSETVYGVARASDVSAALILDPSAFVAVFDAGEEIPIVAEWLYPALAPGSDLVLSSDEVALFKIEVPHLPSSHDVDLYYASPLVLPVRFDRDVPICGGAGGAAPIVIDV